MALTADELDAAARSTVDLYRAAEQAILQQVTRRLGAGMDATDWQAQRLGQLSSLRGSVQRILDATEAEGGPRIRAAVADAWRTGTGRATVGLPAELLPTDPAAVFGQVSRPPTRVDVVESLAGELVSDVHQRHANVLRHVDDVYRTTIQRAAAVSVAGGQTRLAAAQHAYRRFVDQGITGFTDISGRHWRLSSYVEMGVRTVTQRAAVQGQTDRLQDLGLDLVIISDSPRECSLCLVPGTVVEGPAPTGRTRSEYTGNVVRIVTASGKDLTGTPDHPVLTPRGWVALKNLGVGDQVVSHDRQQGYAGVVPDDVQVPTRIEEAGEPWLPVLLAGPTRRDLDQDVAYRNVRYVSADRDLPTELDPAFSEPVPEELLVGGISPGAAFLGVNDRELGLFRLLAPAPRFMGGLDHGRSLCRGGTRPATPHRLGPAPAQLGRIDLGLSQPERFATSPSGCSSTTQVVADHPTADTEGGAELLRALAGEVTLDEVVSLSVREFSGHVWDLSTGPGWFVASGIVTHNCRPWEGAVLSISGSTPRGWVEMDSLTGSGTVEVRVDGTLDEARRSGLFHPNCTHSARGYLPGATRRQPATANPQGDLAQQRQREIERNVRKWKERELGALDPAAAAGARGKVRAWQRELREHLDANPELKRLRYRERVGAGNIPPTAAGIRAAPTPPSARLATTELPLPPRPARPPRRIDHDEAVAMQARMLDPEQDGWPWTPEQRDALSGYSGADYLDMNSWLRGRVSVDDLVDPVEVVDRKISEAISGMRPLPEPVVVHRAANREAFDAPGQQIDQLDELRGLVGQERQEPGFLSTSIQDGLYDEEVLMEIRVPAETSAAYLEEITESEGEFELLLAPGQRFRILEVAPSDEEGRVMRMVVEILL